MKLFFIIIFPILILLGCSNSKVNIDGLQIRQGKYYSLNAQKPFSGEAISKFDDGNIASIIELKEGVPNGKWITYGYKQEIIQEGFYHPINVSNETEFMKDSIKRLNVCTTKEGEIEFTDIFLITDKNDKKDVGNEKSKITAFLKKRSILIKGDTINEIKYARGELEN